MMTIHDELQIKHELHTGQRFTEGAVTYRHPDCSECNGTGGGRFRGPGDCDGCDGVGYRIDLVAICVECTSEKGKPHFPECTSGRVQPIDIARDEASEKYRERIARAIASGTHAATRAGR